MSTPPQPMNLPQNELDWEPTCYLSEAVPTDVGELTFEVRHADQTGAWTYFITGPGGRTLMSSFFATSAQAKFAAECFVKQVRGVLYFAGIESDREEDVGR